MLFWLFPWPGVGCLHMTSGSLLSLLQLFAFMSPLSVPDHPIMMQSTPPTCTPALPIFLTPLSDFFLPGHILLLTCCLLWLFTMCLTLLQSKFYGVGSFLFFMLYVQHPIWWCLAQSQHVINIYWINGAGN